MYISGNKLYSFPESITKLKNLYYLGLNNNDLKDLPQGFISYFPNLSTLGLENNRFARVSDKLIEHVKSHPTTTIYLNYNYIDKVGDSVKYSIWIKDSKKLVFVGAPGSIYKDEKINLFNYLKTESDYDYINKYYNEMGPDDIDFNISLMGNESCKASITTDGLLNVSDAGTYQITARIKGSDAGNTSAFASTRIIVSDNTGDSDLYNPERMEEVFPDLYFRNIVLEKLGQSSLAVDWGMVTDSSLGSITDLFIYIGVIESIKGLEKLTGLSKLTIDQTYIKGFPYGIENNL